MDLFHIIAEERIKKAYDNGEFENLPGYGRPLKLDDLSGIPEELRMAYKILKNAGYTEEENHLRREVLTIEDLIKRCNDNNEKKNLRKKLNEKLLRYNGVMSKRRISTNSDLFKNYEQRIYERLNKN